MKPWQWNVLAVLNLVVGAAVLMSDPSWFGVCEVWLGGVCVVCGVIAEAREIVK